MSNLKEQGNVTKTEPDQESRRSVVSRQSVTVKLRVKLAAFGKRGENVKFEWRSKLQMFYFLVAFAMTPDDLMYVEDPSEVHKQLTLYHMIIIYLFFALPLLYMELFLGQYSKLNILHLGKMTPLVFGLGMTMLMIFLLRVALSTCTLGDILIYIMYSVSAPWQNCDTTKNDIAAKYICIPLPKQKQQGSELWSEDPKARLSAYIYWRVETLRTNDTEVYGFGDFVVPRLVSLSCIWIVVFVLLILTLTPGKLSFLFKLFLWTNVICIVIEIIFFLSKEGATTYLHSMFWTSFENMINLRVYCFGIHNTLVSVSLAQGGYMIIGSYLKLDTSASLCGIMVIGIHFISLMTAYVYKYASIGILGHTYNQLDSALHIQENDALFATIVQALGVVTFTRLVTFIYFLQMCLSYLGNVITRTLLIFSTIVEARDEIQSYKTYVVGGVCILCYVFAVMFVTETGPFRMMCLKVYVLMTVHLMVLVLETVSTLWLYTFPRMSDDIHFLYGSQPTIYWKIGWAVLPAISVIVLIFYCMDIDSYKYDAVWYHIIYFIFLLFPLIGGGIYKAYKSLRKHNLVAVLKPENDWGPRDPEVRQIRLKFVPRLETRLKRRTYVCKHRCLLQSEYLKYLMEEEEKWFNFYTGRDKEFPHGSDKSSDDEGSTSISSKTTKSSKSTAASSEADEDSQNRNDKINRIA